MRWDGPGEGMVGKSFFDLNFEVIFLPPELSVFWGKVLLVWLLPGGLEGS